MGGPARRRDVDDQHPTVPTWTPAPPPERRRRLGPALAAVATGLLAALDRKDLDRAAGYLDQEERLLLATYRDRLVAVVAGRLTGGTGDPMAQLDLTARDVRFARVGGS